MTLVLLYNILDVVLQKQTIVFDACVPNAWIGYVSPVKAAFVY